MAGDQNITALPVKTAPAAGDQMMMIDQAEGYLIDYKQLAKAFLAELQTMEFSQLQTVAKNLLSAVNELNSKTMITEFKQSAKIEEYNESTSVNGIRIMFGIITDTNYLMMYLSLDVNWVRIQFRTDGIALYYRIIYGLSEPTAWRTV